MSGGELRGEEFLLILPDTAEEEEEEEEEEVEIARRLRFVVAAVESELAAGLEDARENVLSRFETLVRAQDLLTSADWKPTDLGDVVRGALATVDGDGRLSIGGCAIEIGSRASLSFTLVLHELATNAVKYGALSTPDGRVNVNWRLHVNGSDPCLAFTWTEAGGPPVRPPARRGFGTRLIDSMGRTFGGRSELRYEPTGVRWLVEANPTRLKIT